MIKNEYKTVELVTHKIDGIEPGKVFRVSKEWYDNISSDFIDDMPSNLREFLFQESRTPSCDNIEPLMMCRKVAFNDYGNSSYLVNLRTGQVIKIWEKVRNILDQLTFSMYDFSFGNSSFAVSRIVTSDAVRTPGELYIDYMDTNNIHRKIYKNADGSIKTDYTMLQDVLTLFPLRMCIRDKSESGRYYLLDLTSGYFESCYFCDDGSQKAFMKLDPAGTVMSFTPITN